MPTIRDRMMVGINVFPDLGQFGKRLAAGVEKATKTVRGDVTVTAKLDDKAFKLGAADLRKQRDELSKKIASIPVDVKDKAARAKLLDLRAMSDKLDGRKITEDITLQGAAKFSAQLLRLEVQADKLQAKLKNENVRGGIGGRLAGLIPGLGGGGASAGAGAAPAGAPLLGGLGVPGGIAAVVAGLAALPFAAQAAGAGIVAGLGGGLAALGIAGALYAGKASKALGGVQVSANQLAAAHDSLRAAQLRVTAAQDKLSRLQGSGKASAAQLASAQAGLASAQGSVASAQDRLNKLQGSAAAQAAAKGQAATYAAQQRARQSFATLAADAKLSLASIGLSFIPVMESVASTADKTLKKLTPVFAGAVRTIAAPFKNFTDTLITSFSQPAMRQAIQGVADAFGAILKALTPALPGMIKGIADGIKSVAHAISANPQAFADFIKFLFQVVEAALKSIAWLTKVATYIEQHFGPAMHRVAVIFDGVRGEIHRVWGQIFTDTIGAVIRIGHNVETQFNSLRHSTANIWDGVRHDAAHYWDMIWNNTVGRIIRGGQDAGRAFTNIKNWVHDRFLTPLSNFFTQSIPNAFKTAVSAIGRFWVSLEGTVKGPVNWVLLNVVDKLFGVIDRVTSFVGLGKPLPTNLKLARGGRVPGSGQGDTVAAMLTPGEVVVPAGMVARGAVDHLRGKLPGFASGGLVNPIGRGLRPERIDMGVDYGGFGALYALGSGQITSTDNSGWPGGTFIDLRLNPPYGSGYWYYAEDIQPAVRVGQGVAAGQLLGHAYGGPSGIEVGWASGVGGQTMAAASGQAAAGQAHGDPGLYSTAWGVAASNLIASLGGPRGILSKGPVQGGTAGIGGIIRTIEQIFSGLGNVAKIAIDLAHGDAAGAGRALAALIPKSAGKAGGLLGKTLLALPGKLISMAMKFLVSKVKGFAAGQQAAGGGGSGALGGDPAANKRLAEQMFPADWKSQGMWPSFDQLEMSEARYDRFARNPSSGAYGIPQALPESKLPFAGQARGGSHAGPQLTWMYQYIRSRYGNPFGAELHELAHHWYGRGGLVPGMAAGGSVTTVTDPGGPAAVSAYRALLGTEEHREGLDYAGLQAAFARGPAKYRAPAALARLDLAKKQAAEAAAYRKLAGAGLTKVNLDRLGAAARAESLAGLHDTALSHLPGGHPGWARGLRYWLGQLSGTAARGLPGGQVTSGPAGAGLPQITHEYGSDVSDVLGAMLHSVMAPFALGGRVRAYDQGGYLPVGTSLAFNGTGRPEPVGQQAVTVNVELSWRGGNSGDELMALLRKNIKVRNGGSVQRALGSAGQVGGTGAWTPVR